jgi:hypothetical protein
LLHGGKELGDAFARLFGVALCVFQEFGEYVAGQQVFVFGKHAKQALHQEVGDALAVQAVGTHVFGNIGKLPGGQGGDGCGGFFRAEFFGIGEDPAQELARSGVGQFFDADFAQFVRVAGKGGVDDDAFAVRHHQQQRWAFQLEGVVSELFEGQVQVAPRFFVFPAKEAALPDVGPAVPTSGFFCPALETVVVGVAWLVHAQQFAQVVKVRLRPATLRKLVVFPGGNEFLSLLGL